MASLKRFLQRGRLEAGCDEAGRGCLAGPVFAAAVILPPRIRFPKLNDSKQLKVTDRDELRQLIEERATAWAVASVDCSEIDQINILNASIKAMHLAVNSLQVKPDWLLIDGNRFKTHPVPHTCVIKGDGKFMSIAAASILAKTHRDAYIEKLHLDYPVYNWAQNKGYPTAAHRNAILINGTTPHHRMSFKLLPNVNA